MTMNTKNIIAGLRKNMLLYGLILFVLLLFMLFRKPFILLLLIAGGGLSTIYKLVINVSIGFELITFFSILITYAYGIGAGIISMALMTLISHFTTGRICPTMFGKMMVYAVVLAAALFFSPANIASVGIGLSVAVYALFFFMYIFVFGYNPISSFTSAAGGIFFNYIFFSRLGEALLKLLI